MQTLKDLEKKVFATGKPKEQRVAVLGTKGSGKSTSLGLLHITCIDLANDPKENFFCRVDEQAGLGIRTAASDLRDGKFPPETKEGYIFEANMIMKWKNITGTRTVRLPFCETAGEEIAKLIMRFSEGMYDVNPEHFQHATQLHEYILESNGFIIIAPTTRAPIFDGKSLEPEPENIMQRPDVNIARLLECVYEYKERTGSTPIKAIAVLLTKYDLVQDPLLAQGIDLTKKEGVLKFMNAYFPETHSILRFYGIERVHFFPSWVELEKDKKGNYVQLPDGTYKIKTFSPKEVQKYGKRLPYYNQPGNIELVRWIRDNFAS